MKDFVIDLFHGEYHGAWKGAENTDRGHKPVIKPMAYGVPAPTASMKRSKTFPHPLDLDENVWRFEVPNGPDLRFLIPTDDIPGVELDSTIWGRMQMGQKEELKRWKEEADSLKTRLRQKQKKIERLEEDKEDVTDRGSGKTQNLLQCRTCMDAFPREEYKDNGGYCPSCDTLHPSYSGEHR